MPDEMRIALARAELEKGVGFIKAAIQLISPITRPSITQLRGSLVDEMLDIEACASRLGNA